MKSDVRSDILKSAKLVASKNPPQMVMKADPKSMPGVKKTHAHGKHTKAGKSHLGLKKVSPTKVGA